MLNNNRRKPPLHNMKTGIAGAGIIGRLLAFELANAGHEVTLFDKDNAEGLENCSMAAAGLLNPVSELEKSPPLIFQLGFESLKNRWPKIIEQLDPTIYFRSSGSIAISHPQDQAELTQFINTISNRLKQQDLYRLLSQQELHNLEPALTKFTSGYHFPIAGQLDNQAIMQALGNKLRGMKPKIHWHSNTIVNELTPGKINCADKTHPFDVVFDCRGLGGKSTFSNLRGVRGELIWLHAPGIHIKHPIRLMHPRYTVYLVPRPEQIFLLGASEIESEDMSPISVRTALELLSGIYSLHSGFSEARILKTVANCRPTLSSHLPQIKYREGLIAINGLYRHGFLMAPSLIDEVLRLVEKGPSSLQYPEIVEHLSEERSS